LPCSCAMLETSGAAWLCASGAPGRSRAAWLCACAARETSEAGLLRASGAPGRIRATWLCASAAPGRSRAAWLCACAARETSEAVLLCASGAPGRGRAAWLSWRTAPGSGSRVAAHRVSRSPASRRQPRLSIGRLGTRRPRLLSRPQRPDSDTGTAGCRPIHRGTSWGAFPPGMHRTGASTNCRSKRPWSRRCRCCSWLREHSRRERRRQEQSKRSSFA
jgi:hypothetical protein